MILAMYKRRRFLGSSALACGVVVIGSIGPWASGYLDVAGTESYGWISIGSIGLAALSVWLRVAWQKPTLASANFFGSVCIAAGVYGAYQDVYGPYLDAGDTWIEHVGWGLILTVVGAALFLFICLSQYRDHEISRGRTTSRLKVGILASVLPVAAAGIVVALSVNGENRAPEPVFLPGESEKTIPDYALRIADGHAEGSEWSMWLFGNGQKENCFGTKSARRRFPRKEGGVGSVEQAYCGYGVPPLYWQQIAEAPIGDASQREAEVVLLTRENVDYLQVLTSSRKEGDKGLKVVRLEALKVPTGLANDAQLRRNFAYAVGKIRAPACIRRVVLFDQEGVRLRRTPLLSCKSESPRSSLFDE